MRTTFSGIMSAAVLGLMIFGTTSRADEIAVAKVPDKLMTVVKAKYPSAEYITAFKDTDEKEIFFSIVLKYKSHEYEVTLNSKGEFLQIAKELRVKELPAPVTDGLLKKHPNAKIKEAAEVKEPGQQISLTYHLEIDTVEKTTLEVILDATGKILQEEASKDAK